MLSVLTLLACFSKYAFGGSSRPARNESKYLHWLFNPITIPFTACRTARYGRWLRPGY
jgi:hypothetical protein